MSAEKIGQQGMQTKIQKLNKTRFTATFTKTNAPMILKIALATSDTSQDTPSSSILKETGPSSRAALVSSARHLLPVQDCLDKDILTSIADARRPFGLAFSYTL
jgi:hypothetical protein